MMSLTDNIDRLYRTVQNKYGDDGGKPSSFLLLNLFAIILIIAYISYHIFNGNYSLAGYGNLNDILESKVTILCENREKISRKQNQVRRLQNESLDLDLFEEESKRSSGVGSDNEIVLSRDNFLRE